MKGQTYTKRKCVGCGEECFTPGFEMACDGCEFHQSDMDAQELIDMLEEARTRNAELEAELARVRGQRDGLVAALKVKAVDKAMLDRRAITTLQSGLKILQEIAQEAQEQGGEGEL